LRQALQCYEKRGRQNDEQKCDYDDIAKHRLSKPFIS
jgi:hypothetical protein